MFNNDARKTTKKVKKYPTCDDDEDQCKLVLVRNGFWSTNSDVYPYQVRLVTDPQVTRLDDARSVRPKASIIRLGDTSSTGRSAHVSLVLVRLRSFPWRYLHSATLAN
ncbi:hypothetical protein QAD02_018028 [Eretmocerus hayati]|uniref:Uncharacterized protein n=1 Tax=Eretmocerus hayati TaxID=131215 RepID=A0ACC2PFI3_9HYME|nr:hypothetical protein QAD02_018028 [Eretmocerus hayati]